MKYALLYILQMIIGGKVFLLYWYMGFCIFHIKILIKISLHKYAAIHISYYTKLGKTWPTRNMKSLLFIYINLWTDFHTWHKIRNKTRVSTFTTVIQSSFGSPSYNSQRRKRNKRNPDQKRRSIALTVYRWRDDVHRKPWCYQKITRSNQWT